MNLDIVFIILNYKIFQETVDCVKSIENNIDSKKYHIIIVDNGSPNAVGNQLAQFFNDNSHVTVQLLPKNIGFAQGNNEGINRARSLGAKYICCLNNDTLLLSKNLVSILNKKFKKYACAVIGPKIVLNDSTLQYRSPALASILFYKKQLNAIEHQAAHPSYKDKFKKYKWIKFIYSKIRGYISCAFVDKTDVVLHGCCLIFTPIFFTKLKGFNPNTFLYLEEELLFANIQVNQLHTLYTPEIVIRHLEDVSTNAVVEDKQTKQAFLRIHTKHSLAVLIQFLQEHQSVLYNLSPNKN